MSKIEALAVVAIGEVFDAGEKCPGIIWPPVGTDVAHGEARGRLF